MRQSTIDKYTNLVIDLYVNEKMPIYKIAKNYHVWENTIKQILVQNNIKLRTRSESLAYDVNSNYFERLDSAEKHYWLGWLATDGFSNPNTKIIGLSINEGDRKIVELFKKSIESKMPIEVFDNEGGFNPNHKMCRLRFCNQKFTNDLANLGIKENKSENLSFPKIDNRYFYPFLRGTIEGDGEIRIVRGRNGKTLFSVVINGNKDFLSGIVDFLQKEGIYFNVRRHKNCDKNNCYRIYTQNKLDIIKLLDKVYENCGDFFLDRKYDVYLKMKQFLLENPIKSQYITSKKSKNKMIFNQKV